MRRLTARAVHLIWALGLLGVFFVGVPWLLFHVSLGEQVREFVSAPGESMSRAPGDDLLLAFVALIAWLCWFLFVRLLVSEAWGVLRGRPIRVWDTPFPRRFARVIVSWLFVGSTMLPVASAGVLVVSPQVFEVPMDLASRSVEQEPGLLVDALVPAAAPRATSVDHIVERRDTLWGLAERYLGEGQRWPELYETNRGVQQPDGRCLEDPSLILVGWKLSVPSSSAGAGQVGTSIVGVPQEPELRVPSIDTRKPEAQPEPSVAQEPETLQDIPTELESTPPVLTSDPDLLWIEPLEILRDDSLARVPAVETSGVTGLAASAGSLIAVGLGVSLDRLRRARRRGFDAESGPQRLEQRLAQLCAEVNTHQTPDGIGAFWLEMRERKYQILSAHVTDSELSVLIRSGHTMSPPWRSRSDGWWAAPRSAALGQQDAVWPELLVEVGTQGEQVYVDLTVVSSVRISGDAEARLVGLLQQLREPSWGTSPEIMLVGQYATMAGDGERKARDLTDVLPEIRSRAGGDETPLVLVVAADEPLLTDVVVLAAGGGSCVIVVGEGAEDCALELRLADGCIEIDHHFEPYEASLGTAVTTGATPVALSAADVSAIHELLARFREVEQSADVEPPASTLALSRSADIELELLGEVGITGVRSPLAPQQLAVVAFLHLNPGATAESLQQAVWGGRPPSGQRFRNVISEVRSVLGHGAFPVAEAGKYRLGEQVTSDLARFEALASESGDALDEALSLVRGVPLTTTGAHRRHFGWVDLENLSSYWELQVLRASLRSVEAKMRSGDYDGAVIAARQGLLGCPLNEELTRQLISAHIGAGQTRIAANVAYELVRALDELGVDDLEPATEALIAPLRIVASTG